MFAGPWQCIPAGCLTEPITASLGSGPMSREPRTAASWKEQVMLQTVGVHIESGETANTSSMARRSRHLAIIAIIGSLDCPRLKMVSTVRPSLANRPVWLEITSSNPSFVTCPARYHQVVETLRRDGQACTLAPPCAKFRRVGLSSCHKPGLPRDLP